MPVQHTTGPTRFSRSHRLTTARQYREVFAKSLKSSDQYFTILAQLGHDGSPRLGLAISRRFVPRAVDRNRLKRLVRESFRHRLSLWHKLPINLIVMARSRAAGSATNADIAISLANHWSRLTLKLCATSFGS